MAVFRDANHYPNFFYRFKANIQDVIESEIPEAKPILLTFTPTLIILVKSASKTTMQQQTTCVLSTVMSP
jgi:hypothetical protein